MGFRNYRTEPTPGCPRCGPTSRESQSFPPSEGPGPHRIKLVTLEAGSRSAPMVVAGLRHINRYH